MNLESLAPSTVSNRLFRGVLTVAPDRSTAYLDLWNILIVRSFRNHLCVPISQSAKIFFTKRQLSHIHQQFFHPSAMKLFQLIKRSRPEEATTDILNPLKEITQRWNPFQRIWNAPTRFRVTIGARHTLFNERILLDIMCIDDDYVLHIVDGGTNFSAARFLLNIYTENIWKRNCPMLGFYLQGAFK